MRMIPRCVANPRIPCDLLCNPICNRLGMELGIREGLSLPREPEYLKDGIDDDGKEDGGDRHYRHQFDQRIRALNASSDLHH